MLNPSGLCMCGCSEMTRRSPKRYGASGYEAGDFFCFITGHHRRRSPHEYLVEDRGFTTPCWIWQRAKSPLGYGVVGVKGSRVRLAHRVFFQRHVGELKDGFVLDHLCRVPSCVNPSHLEQVTQQVNTQRGRINKHAALVGTIRAMAMDGMGATKISRALGIPVPSAAGILNRRRWSNL